MAWLKYLSKRLVLVAGGIGLALLALEGAARLLNLGYPTSFLIKYPFHGETAWVDNQVFGYRFFAPAVTRTPPPILVPATKSTNEFRVVVLGESAAMGEPEPAFGPVRMLELMLQQRHPDRKITVVNAAMTAINSYVIADISTELGKLQPDAVILYIGNNEVVGPMGPATVFTPASGSHALNRWRVKLSRWRVASAARQAWHAWKGGDADIWEGMAMFDRQRAQVPRDDPRLPGVYRALAANLNEILEQIHKVNAHAILCTVAVNLADQAPLDGQPFPATASLDEYKDLRDADALRFRADRGINNAIRQVVRTHPGVRLVDIEQLLEQSGPPGRNYFLDHVHFNLNGSYLVANRWLDTVEQILRPGITDAAAITLDRLKELMMWNPHQEIAIIRTMLQRYDRPPFRSASDYQDQMMYWSLQRAATLRAIEQLSTPELLDECRAGLAQNPSDPQRLYEALPAFLNAGNAEEAGLWARRLLDLWPHRADIRGWLVMIESIRGNAKEAWSIMTRDAPPLGQIPADLIVGLSETLQQTGYAQAALELLELASSEYPDRYRLQFLLALRHLQSGSSRAEASAIMSRLIREHPDLLWLKEEYAVILLLDGRIDEAAEQLEPSRRSPDPERQIKWIHYLMAVGRLDEATTEIDRMTADHPSFAEAWLTSAGLGRRAGDVHREISAIETYTRLKPWDTNAWKRLAGLYETAGQPEDARKAREQAARFL